MNIRQAFEILGLSPDASREDANKEFRNLSKMCHPDKSDDPNASQMFQFIRQAIECIRSAPDEELALFRLQTSGHQRRTTDSPAEVYFQAGLKMLRHPITYQVAIGQFTQAIQIDPQYAEAYYYRGAAYQGLRMFDRAIQDFNKAIFIDPVYVNAYYDRGIIYHYGLKVPELAIFDYSQVIYLNPSDADAYSQRGDANSDLGDYSAAVQDYNSAINLNPNASEIYTKRGNAYCALGYYDLAVRDYNTARWGRYARGR